MSKELSISTAPTTAILEASRNQSLTFAKAISELIDNSFDARATRVQIGISKNQVTVTDNGQGCSDIGAMIQQGRHIANNRAALGRYGVGLKDAAHWFWGQTSIATSDGAFVRTLQADWPAIVKSGKWDNVRAFESEWTLQAVEECGIQGRGTRITFNNIEKRTNAKGIESLVRELGFMFWPALRDGRQIEVAFNGKPYIVAPFRFPLMEDRIEREFSVNGKVVKLTAGVVAHGQPNEVRGHAIAYQHRVIQKHSLACGDFGSSRFFGWVELGEGWRLARNKDSITDDADALNEAILRESLPVLTIANSASEMVALDQLKNEVEAGIGGALADLRKAKRKPSGKEKGTVEPTGKGKEHERAENRHETPGKYRPFDGLKNRGIGGIICHFASEGIDQPIGRVDPRAGGKLVATLNQDHPFMAEMMKEKTGAFYVTVASLVANFIASQDEDTGGQLWIKFKDYEAHERYTVLLTDLLRSRSQPLKLSAA